jgi:hypothetical protein
MAYFQHLPKDKFTDGQSKWQAVINEQIEEWPKSCKDKLGDVQHPLEAKALFVFTMARRTIQYMVEARGIKVDCWKAYYPQTYSLIFPIMEMFGKAVTGINGGTDKLVGYGLTWLFTPSDFPKIVDRFEGRVSFLIDVRNYVLHGVSSIDDSEKITNIKKMDAKEPYRLASQLEKSMSVYWENLCNDFAEDGGWLDRLARARIVPFYIPGSGHYEKALISPDIVDYLQRKSPRLLPENT